MFMKLLWRIVRPFSERMNTAYGTQNILSPLYHLLHLATKSNHSGNETKKKIKMLPVKYDEPIPTKAIAQ